MSPLRRFATATLGYTLAVIVWGGFVRASGSGAGCGRHWPLCNGVVVPTAPASATLIEFAHRLTSGLALLLVVALAVWIYRTHQPGHRVRRAAAWSMAFIVIEALIGAGLVLLGLVGDDSSSLRAIYLAGHLGNTFALLGALTTTVLWIDQAEPSPRAAPTGRLRTMTTWALGLVLVVAMTGAITALGDTLFPTDSLREGPGQDGSATAHFLIRLRVIHPALAVVSAIVVLLTASRALGATHAPSTRTAARWFGGLMVAQVTIGVINLWLLVPIATQLLHLLMADLVWIAGVALWHSAGRGVR